MGLEILLLIGGAYYLTRKKVSRTANATLSSAGFEQENINPTIEQQIINSQTQRQVIQRQQNQINEVALNQEGKTVRLQTIRNYELRIIEIDRQIADQQATYQTVSSYRGETAGRPQRNKQENAQVGGTLRNLDNQLRSINESLTNLQNEKSELQRKINEVVI